ncbi:MAG: GspE/PulE family protein [Patescibacteria group bacterium]|nr:GspE/PulE family protein [Patescibacteria group bacterium]
MDNTPASSTPYTPQEKLSGKIAELELKEKERQTKAQADEQGLPYINLDKFPISQEAIKLLPRDQAEALQTLCFLYSGDEIRLASLNPNNPQLSHLKKELADKLHANVKIYFISENSLQIGLAVYEKIPQIIHLEGVQIKEEDLQRFEKELNTFEKVNQVVQKIGLSEIVTIIISAGLQFRASDIHIEAEEKDVKIRLRIDGVLHDVVVLPKDAWPKINSRIKLLAGLKINIENKPQDGRFTINLSKDVVDVRVSSIPSAFGESIVLRLLRASAVGLEFESLGLRGKSFNDLKNEIDKPNGMVLATGPTGSGKTTTLYAILNKINSPDTKIVTLEDPIEYKLPGIVQSQVQSSDGQSGSESTEGESRKKDIYTFGRGIRAMLRQDPDVVMVGEIRDLETADTAINAALTGHLMLSTLHTNSAAATIPRLLAMGVKPFLLAPSLNAIIGQRLVRRLCQHCKQEDNEIDNKTMTAILNALNAIAPESGYKPDLNNLKFYKSPGCEKCQKIGYKGRVGIYEVMLMTPEIEKMILSGQASEYEIEKIAVANGMINLLQDGLLKALEGVTSISEIISKVKT